MAEIHRGSDISAGSAEARPRRRLPSTDLGTVVIHWVVAIALFVSMLTGLRIATEGLNAPISNALKPILPQGEVWSVHLISGLTLFFGATAYIVYMARSGLAARISGRRLKPLAELANARLRWAAINVALHWLMYAIIATMAVTGVVMFFGHGGWVVRIHTIAALTALSYIFVHVASHFMFGGWRQLLRIFRPLAPLGSKAGARPLLVATIVGVLVAVGLASLDLGSRDVLHVARTATPPRLDGNLDDAVWQMSPVIIHTEQGANLHGTGESTVEVRAVHDGTRIYFAFRWEDPTRSLRRIPMVKREDGWHLIGTRVDIVDVPEFYEDKFVAMFSPSDAFGSGNSIHLGAKPLADKPGPLHGRGEHYTTDGSYIDVWHWKATRGGLLGQIDDQHFGPPKEPNAAETAGQVRYQAGYQNDPGDQAYLYNYAGEPPGGFRGPVKVQRLPKDWRAMQALMGPFDPDPEVPVAPEYRGWWMTESESVPYSAEVDADIPVGTIIPGLIIMRPFSGDRADVSAAAEWRDGHWNLEASRALKTGSNFDQDFVPGRPLYLWVGVFDHNETRHTRHPRPIRIDLD